MDWSTRYSYHFPTSIRFGAGVIDELPAYLNSIDKKNVFFVTDAGLAGLDIFKSIIKNLENKKFGVHTYTGIDKNPIKSNVLNGVKAFHESKSDVIIGLGGGASMDVARAIALGAYHDRDLFDFDDAKGGDKYATEEIPHFITVPTTSGTGSEVGRSTVIADDITHHKKVLFSPRLMAKMVFADPELTMTLPASITAATGIDALTHNIEAFVAKGFSPLCDGIAIEGVRLIAQALTKATKNPCLESRSKMMLAALMGATAFQKGLGVVHSLAHPLSTLFDTHHGLANAIMLPYGIEYNSTVVQDRYDFLAKVIGVNDLKQWTLDLNEELGIQNGLNSLGVTLESVDELSKIALADACHACNPKVCTEEDFKNLYTKAIEG